MRLTCRKAVNRADGTAVSASATRGSMSSAGSTAACSCWKPSRSSCNTHEGSPPGSSLRLDSIRRRAQTPPGDPFTPGCRRGGGAHRQQQRALQMRSAVRSDQREHGRHLLRWW